MRSSSNVAARIVSVREALEDGAVGHALDLVRDLERELPTSSPSGSCPECGFRMWPGQLAKHLSVVHAIDAYGRAA
jgi:hypothetical protein